MEELVRVDAEADGPPRRSGHAALWRHRSRKGVEIDTFNLICFPWSGRAFPLIDHVRACELLDRFSFSARQIFKGSRGLMKGGSFRHLLSPRYPRDSHVAIGPPLYSDGPKKGGSLHTQQHEREGYRKGLLGMW